MLGILAIVLSGVFAYFAPKFFQIPESLLDDTRIIIVFGGVMVAVTLISGVYGGMVAGIERFDIQSNIEIFFTIARAVAIVLALREGYGLVSLAGIQLAASVLNCVAFWAAAHRLYKDVRRRLLGPLFPQMRMLLSFGISVSVIYVFGAIILYSDALIIAAFLSIEAVAFFAIAGSLCVYATELARALAYLMVPRLSVLTSMGSDKMGDEILAVAKFATLIVTPIAAIFVLRGESFITLWMGPEYGATSAGVLRILAIIVWLEASRSVVIHSLAGMARQRMLMPGLAFEAFFKLLLSIWLVHPLGLEGVALGSLISSLLVSLGYIPRCLSKVTGDPIKRYFSGALLLPTVACIPFMAMSIITDRIFPVTNLAAFFVQVALILPLVPLTAWFLCFSSREKMQIDVLLRRVVGSSRAER